VEFNGNKVDNYLQLFNFSYFSPKVKGIMIECFVCNQMQGEQMDRINCLQCQHYYSTWDKDLPRGCKLYGIKTMQMPSLAVKRESGSKCAGYEQKKHFQKKKESLDLNDPSLW
jgi:hypothetical protein